MTLNGFEYMGKPLEVKYVEDNDQVPIPTNHKGMMSKWNNKTTVYVKNLSWDTTAEELKQFFEQCGEVVNCQLITIRGYSKGYGFVEFTNEKSVKKALSLNRDKLKGKELYINRSIEKQEDDSDSTESNDYSSNANDSDEEIKYNNIDAEGRMYYSCGDNKIIGVVDYENESKLNIDNMTNAELFDSEGIEYCFYGCVSFMMKSNWSDYQNEITKNGGEVTTFDVTIQSTQTTPYYCNIGDREYYGLEGDFPLVLPVRIYEYSQYALVYVDPFTRGNPEDRIVINVTRE